MPRPTKPPRLWLRKRPNAKGETISWWFIKDGGRVISTSCLAHQAAEAEQMLAEYIAEKHNPQRGGRAADVTISDVLSVYLEEKSEATADTKRTEQTIWRLNEYFGSKPVAAIKGPLCRQFAEHRKTESGARRDLECLRAAVRYYHVNYGLDVVPGFSLPPKSLPRDRYLTRSEAAALLWAAMGWRKQEDGKWRRQKDHKRRHLARLILIGLYTGTRPGAILSLQWMRSTSGGWADINRGVIFRRADGERVAHNKRKPPVKMARKLIAHMKRWHRIDGWSIDSTGLRYVVHYHGAPIVKLNKAFRSAVAAAGLTSEITPHVLRHTRGTWLSQAGVPSNEAAASLGLTVEEYERTYLHNDPNFQKSAADAY